MSGDPDTTTVDAEPESTGIGSESAGGSATGTGESTGTAPPTDPATDTGDATDPARIATQDHVDKVTRHSTFVGDCPGVAAIVENNRGCSRSHNPRDRKTTTSSP